MTQQVINTGAVANDGTGESLRNAFDAVNNNFANIWTAGPVDSQVVISNNRISTTVQNLALVLAGNGVGTITVDSTVVPGIDSVYDLGTANSRFDSVYSRYFYGNGAFLSGISNGSGSATSVTFAATPPLAANIGDIWIQSDTGIQYLYFNDNTSNQWAEMEAYQSFSSGGTGNGNVDLTSVSSDIIPSTNNSYSLGSSGYQWKDLWVSNSTIYLNSLPITADGANLKVNGNTVLTTSSPLSFSNLSVTGNVSANAVYTNNYFYANGAPFPQGSNSLPGTTISLKDNVIATTTLNQNLVLSANGVGNVQTNSSIMPDATQIRDIGSASNKFNSIYAGYYYGNGSQLTGISAGNSNSIISGNSNVKIVSAGGNVTIGIGGIGNIVVVSGAGEYVTGVVSASGNITAPYFVGNGSLLTGITTVAAANTAQTVTANAQANITSVGTLTSLSVTGTVQGGNILTSGIVSTTGNITGNFFIGNGSQLTGLAATYGNSNVVANLAALGSNPVSTTGNVTGGNLVTGAQVVASGVIQTGTGFSTGGYLSVDGDTDLHKTTVTGNLSATGNITANVSSFFIGNGSQLTGIVSSYGNTNVVANLAALGSNPISTTGNVTSGNVSTGVITLTNGAVIKDTAGNAIAIGYLAGNTSQGSYATAIGFGAGGTSQGTDAVAIGGSAGSSSQGNYGVSMGYLAGQNTQGTQAVAIGLQTGGTSQGAGAVALGAYAGRSAQGTSAVAVGYLAGNTTQGNNSVAMGRSAGETTQGTEAVAIGLQAGFASQGNYAVAIGKFSANSSQGNYAVAVGPNAGFENQSSNAVSIGSTAGASSQGINSVAVGVGAAYNTQGNSAVAVGNSAGYLLQGLNSVAIGDNAGFAFQGVNSIAIGRLAGNTSQGNNSIILNATGAVLDQITANTFTVAPVRNDVANTAQVMFYNTTSKEITYGNTISVAGNITGNYFIGNGSQLSSVATQVTGSWTLAVGTNTVSLTVPGPGTYSIWVNGNIPNGIVTYTATIVVTNTNVPVVGSSYGWYYAAGNQLVLTAIPNQIVGTLNNISTATVVTTTANVFTFGITNNSGSSQVVNYGYTKL